jgi:hypothetical protein
MNKSNEAKVAGTRINAALRGVLCLLVGVLWSPSLSGQSPDEHASHHPGQAGGAAPAMGGMPAVGGSPGPGGMGPPAGVGPPGGMGGMMEGMGEMMKGMGKPPPKELYPSLMALPELSPEQRKQVEEQAAERMHAGTMLMGQALDSLNAGTQSGDYAAMQEAMTRLREGAAQLESGIAARRALAEGRAPRAVALAWFKQEMNLSLAPAPTARQPVGVLHVFTMVLLVAFALAMVAMYFFKMRRAAALFGRIEADKGPPPPGSAPPLAEGKPPAARRPPSGGGPAAPVSA